MCRIQATIFVLSLTGQQCVSSSFPSSYLGPFLTARLTPSVPDVDHYTRQSILSFHVETFTIFLRAKHFLSTCTVCVLCV